jgi:hypothetical protein
MDFESSSEKTEWNDPRQVHSARNADGDVQSTLARLTGIVADVASVEARASRVG